MIKVPLGVETEGGGPGGVAPGVVVVEYQIACSHVLECPEVAGGETEALERGRETSLVD